MLDRKVGDERLAAIEAMHRVYLGRLSTVHASKIVRWLTHFSRLIVLLHHLS